ncbi:MAG: aminotransferase class IV [Bacteroidetes bacterium]|nr:aminotransferase class IV [Bacteroidota bacterium]MCH8523811.1 aminotransferase class IV [Balneolales bacterium]
MSAFPRAIAYYKDGVKLSDETLKTLMSLREWNEGYFETMRIKNGNLPLWSYHLARLKRGEQHTGIALPKMDFIHELFNAFSAGDYRCRLTIIPAGKAASSAIVALYPLPESKNAYRLKSAARPHPFTDSHHTTVKLSYRVYYNEMYSQALTEGADDALLISPENFVSETCIANIIVSTNCGDLLTPAATAMPLEGTGLQYLRDKMAGETLIKQAMLQYTDLIHSNGIWIVNALRGIVPVTQIDDYAIPQNETQTTFLASFFPY